jgi:hypothetical protein
MNICFLSRRVCFPGGTVFADGFIASIAIGIRLEQG